NRQTQCPCLDAVDIDSQARGVRLVLGPHTDQYRALACGGEELIARVQQRLRPNAASILELERKSAGDSQRWDGRRVEYEHHRLVDGRERGHGPGDQRARTILLVLALVPGVKADERDRV